MSTCTTCKNNGNTRGECENATCAYEAREPTIQVPVSVFLDLARVYKEEPQELVNRQSFFIARNLEQRAYRKYQEYRKQLKEAAKCSTG